MIHDGSAHSLPVDTQRRTSFFGDRRVYVYNNGTQDAGIHAGIDFGVPRGSPVGASAGGRVVLARFRIVTGFTVVVEHLPGVYSSYYHLDSLAVAEGQDIKKGENIGRSGSTGISTGPHLHWELRVATEIADPDVFISQPILDKQDILSRIVRTVEEAKRRTVETDR
jgi:murein DD-endopeptidase MepM/ murein hydrolase activator NlpD